MSENFNYLLNTTDAQEWAKAFVELHGGDEGLMLAWFASAIETGRTAGESKYRERAEHLQGLIDAYAAHATDVETRFHPRGPRWIDAVLAEYRIRRAARTEEADPPIRGTIRDGEVTHVGEVVEVTGIDWPAASTEEADGAE